ncbi:acyl-CoA N-acyltransferase [Wilcoxina mikolae CBS 423.85]|nr:acyl-CoA N-acyltransferase [Wilcoxina mikolae CBS 423.85]
MAFAIHTEDWSIDANDALKLALVSPRTGHIISEFGPTFTYPLYGDTENIFGYKQLQMRLMFAADDMEPCVATTYVERVSNVGEVEAEDIIKPLSEVLPESFSQDPAFYFNSLRTRNKSFIPPGVLHTSFHHAGRSYELWRSSVVDAQCSELLGNMQLLVLLYIEGGSVIDLEDEEWSNRRWEVFFLYEKHPDHLYCFIGYCTLYRYYIFNKQLANQSRIRLSQFLILPPFQRKGLGSRFYDYIIQHYLNAPEVREITIEDPSQEFGDLRDRRDLLRLEKETDFHTMKVSTFMSKKKPLSELRERMKMPIRQFHRCTEMKLLWNLNMKDRKERKAFRLILKSRIYKQHSDVLAQLDRLDRIQKLNETYHQVENDYKRLLQAMKHNRVEDADDDGRKPKRMTQQCEEKTQSLKRARVVTNK